MATPYLTVNIIRMQTTTLRIRNCVAAPAHIHTSHTRCVYLVCVCACVRVCVRVCPSVSRFSVWVWACVWRLTSLNLATCFAFVCFTFHLQHLPPYLMPFTKWFIILICSRHSHYRMCMPVYILCQYIPISYRSLQQKEIVKP